MRCLINSTVQDVSLKMDIGYKTVMSTLNRQVQKKVNWSDYTNLDSIGIDEISIKKGHQHFVSIISAKDKSGELSVLEIIEGREKGDILAFFNSIPLH